MSVSTAVDTAVILAAGQGMRLRGHGPDVPKPLVSVAGVPLLLRTLRTVREAGIKRVVVVLGYRAEEIETFLAEQRKALAPLVVETVFNEDWRLSLGLSLLASARAVNEPFLLLMSDHVLSAELVAGLLARGPEPDGAVLAVDRRIKEVFDLDDATKVRTEAARIVAIDKQLADYDAVDCGAFVCTPAVFDALRAATRNGDVTVSDGMRRLAEAGRFAAHDVGTAWWQDCDTPAMLAEAERRLTA